ncbi:MAG: hypothetical protein ACTSRI_14185 [Promethearchaeota archaeon]
MTDEITSLKAQIDQLEIALEKKDLEIITYLDKIEYLEDNNMKLELLVSDEKSNMNGKKTQLMGSILAIKLKEKEKELRDLKDSMGFLRKEKIRLQQELKKFTKKTNSSVIIIEEKKTPPFEDLLSDLQGKINKQKILITKLMQKNRKRDELNERLIKNDMEIEASKSGPSENVRLMVEKNENNEILYNLTEELQKKLIKTKQQVVLLEKKLAECKKQVKKGGKT